MRSAFRLLWIVSSQFYQVLVCKYITIIFNIEILILKCIVSYIHYTDLSHTQYSIQQLVWMLYSETNSSFAQFPLPCFSCVCPILLNPHEPIVGNAAYGTGWRSIHTVQMRLRFLLSQLKSSHKTPCSHCATVTTPPAPKQTSTSKSKSQSQIVQCERALKINRHENKMKNYSRIQHAPSATWIPNELICYIYISNI